MKRIALGVVSAGFLLGFSLPSPAALLVRELWDDVFAGDQSLAGKGDGTTSVGFLSGSTWQQNAAYLSGTNQVYGANNFNVVSGTPDTLPGLPALSGANGGLWKGGGNDWNSAIWATRQLAPSSALDLSADAVYYFSFRGNNAGDVAVGVGFANGDANTADFLGVGLMWNGATGLDSQNAANSVYNTYGVLNQNLAGNNDSVCAVREHSAAGTVNDRGLFVGRLTASSSGNDLLDVVYYGPGSVIDTNLGAISWTVSSSLSASGPYDRMLVWLNGSGNGELDAIRVGTAWEDVTGVTPIPEPGASALIVMAGAVLAVVRRRRTASSAR